MYEEERPSDPIRDTAPENPPSDDARAAPGRLELVREFINTADLEPGEDELTDLPALTAWLRKRRLIGARERLETGDLERALEVREALRRVLADRGAGEAIEERAIRTLNSHPACAQMRVRFDGAGAPRLEPVGHGFEGALAELFAIIEHAASDGSWGRLKVCADHGCRWAFYDNSKNRSRSWCNMAVCGNRAKAREFRRRRRAGEGESPPASSASTPPALG
ncbi:MAG TPA: CGNR zinc finger domain-containing protein [Solirubrobacteraceae bacterium]|jgi:predicted RNA-binding Zn ribbon-like protein